MPLTEPCSEPSGAPQTPLRGFPLGGLISLQSLLSAFPACPCPSTPPCAILSQGAPGWPAPFPCFSSVILLFLVPPVMLSTVTAAEVQLRATSEPSFPGHCLLLFPAPAGRPAFSPVLLQCWSFDDRRPRSHQEAPLTCAWEARLLRSQGMEEAGGCVPITHQALCTVETAGCDPRGSRVCLTHLCGPHSPGLVPLVQDSKGATSCCLGTAVKARS